MPIQIQTVDKMTRLLTFTDRASSFPLSPDDDRVFYADKVVAQFPKENLPSLIDAQKEGYMIASYLLRHPAINDIMLSVNDKGQDALVIALQDGYSWNDIEQPQKTTAFGRGIKNMLSRGSHSKTLENVIVQRLENEFCKTNRALYMDPENIDPENIVQKINDYFQGPKAPAHEGVFQTIKKDNGDVRAIAFKDGTATLAFSGACSSNCSNGNTSITETGLTAAVRRNIPEVQSCRFEKL